MNAGIPEGPGNMETTEKVTKAAGVSDDAVKAATGKTWAEWFALLDAAGAMQMNHTKMAAYLYEQLHCPEWWNQMVAVGYEQERGLRDKHQTPTGYQIRCSKTIGVPIRVLFEAWQNEETRYRWLDAPLLIRKATPEKSVRITWVDGKSSLEVYFYPKGDARSLVSVQHRKLPDAMKAEQMKAHWAEALERLKGILEA